MMKFNILRLALVDEAGGISGLESLRVLGVGWSITNNMKKDSPGRPGAPNSFVRLIGSNAELCEDCLVSYPKAD